ncbi:MAG: hypothetical protein QF489_03145 [Planctomycetota bacterium]|jgi:hypothetical protein|nr:hypothetical protein [Planctomycetota bacterium]
MSRILLKSVAVLGLTLASCSMPFLDGSNSNPFKAHEPTPAHKGGLAQTPDTISKYFLNHDTNTPYSARQGSLWDSMVSVFTSDGRDFGEATATHRPYVRPYSPGRTNGEGLRKLLLEYNPSDPYQN